MLSWDKTYERTRNCPKSTRSRKPSTRICAKGDKSKLWPTTWGEQTQPVLGNQPPFSRVAMVRYIQPKEINIESYTF